MPTKTARGRRLYVLWAAALALLLLAGVFCWKVVVPVWIIRDCLRGEPSTPPTELIDRLGGKRATVRKLAMYRRMPEWIAPGGCSETATMLFGYCGETAVPELRRILRSEEGESQVGAAKALGMVEPCPYEAVPELAANVGSREHGVGYWSFRALLRMRRSRRVTAALAKLDSSRLDVTDAGAKTLAEMEEEILVLIATIEAKKRLYLRNCCRNGGITDEQVRRRGELLDELLIVYLRGSLEGTGLHQEQLAHEISDGRRTSLESLGGRPRKEAQSERSQGR